MSAFAKIRARSSVLAGVASLALTGCMAGGPIASTGSPITQTESQQGADAHPQIVSEFGGSMSGAQADYVAGIGQNIAFQSGLGNSPGSFKVTLLNSSVNNAFAIPGGYVYVTRQLVALMNNEAELAAVLGHEVGHVAARHSAKRQQTAQQNALLGAIGQILSGVLLGDSTLGKLGQQISSTVPELATLRYSRGQELEADGLGVQYLGTAGYDKRAMSTLLASLAAQNSLDAQLQGRDARMPEWASTHPDPASRVQNAQQLAGAANGGTTNRDMFLTRIGGLVYGDDPHQGVIEGSQFIHPDLRLSFAAPQGYYMVNGAAAVSINGNSGRAQMAGGSYSGNLETYVRQVFQKLGGTQQTLAPQNLRKTTVNGLPAMVGTARVQSGESQVDVVVYAYEFSGSQAFHFAAIAPAGQAAVFDPMFASMRRISASEAASVTPRKVEVVTVRNGDTVASLANRMAYTDAREARFRVLNGLASGDTLKAGQKMKIVVKGS
ncbi:M48 family metalloprotease [Altererythrobacter fulvus]|uniref:M48 family metalloprotease n=1 Tax=Caenibius fulvus TaxID=2126012 RepID=UPI003016482A